MPTVLYYGSGSRVDSGAAQWMLRLADGMRGGEINGCPVDLD